MWPFAQKNLRDPWSSGTSLVYISEIAFCSTDARVNDLSPSFCSSYSSTITQILREVVRISLQGAREELELKTQHLLLSCWIKTSVKVAWRADLEAQKCQQLWGLSLGKIASTQLHQKTKCTNQDSVNPP